MKRVDPEINEEQHRCDQDDQEHRKVGSHARGVKAGGDEEADDGPSKVGVVTYVANAGPHPIKGTGQVADGVEPGGYSDWQRKHDDVCSGKEQNVSEDDATNTPRGPVGPEFVMAMNVEGEQTSTNYGPK